MLIESCGANIIWTEPRDVDLDTFEWSLQAKGSVIHREPWRSRNIGSSYHSNGTHVVFGDGSTRYLPGSIDRELVRKMIMGEPWTDDSE